jgi:hypothetical protein
MVFATFPLISLIFLIILVISNGFSTLWVEGCLDHPQGPRAAWTIPWCVTFPLPNRFAQKGLEA